MPRGYRADGTPNGGKREGAGRPAGATSPLPHGTVTALNTARIAERRLETRKDATPEDHAIVQRVYERVADVLEGSVDGKKAPSVLKAGAMIADAVAGPIVQQVEVKSEHHHAHLVYTVADRVLGPAPSSQQPSPPSPQEAPAQLAAGGAS